MREITEVQQAQIVVWCYIHDDRLYMYHDVMLYHYVVYCLVYRCHHDEYGVK